MGQYFYNSKMFKLTKILYYGFHTLTNPWHQTTSGSHSGFTCVGFLGQCNTNMTGSVYVLIELINDTMTVQFLHYKFSFVERILKWYKKCCKYYEQVTNFIAIGNQIMHMHAATGRTKPEL